MLKGRKAKMGDNGTACDLLVEYKPDMGSDQEILRLI